MEILSLFINYSHKQKSSPILFAKVKNLHVLS